MKLNSIPRELMLRNAIREIHAPIQLWVLVKQICGVGAYTARDICLELGWNPESTQLPEMK